MDLEDFYTGLALAGVLACQKDYEIRIACRSKENSELLWYIEQARKIAGVVLLTREKVQRPTGKKEGLGMTEEVAMKKAQIGSWVLGKLVSDDNDEGTSGSNNENVLGLTHLCMALEKEKSLRDVIASLTSKLNRSSLRAQEGKRYAEQLVKAYGYLKEIE